MPKAISKYRIKEDINQPRLLGFLKSRNESSDSSKETFHEAADSITDREPKELKSCNTPTNDLNRCNTQVRNSTVNDKTSLSKRKHPSSSPDTRNSPPTKSIRNCPTSLPAKMSEINNMEERLHDSLTKSLTASLTTSLTTSLQTANDVKLQDAIDSMNNAVNKMMQCSSSMNQHALNIDRVQAQVTHMQEEYEKSRASHDTVKSKVMLLEKKSLESNLVIRGISEERFEKESVTLEKVYSVLVRAIVADNDIERNLAVRRIGIKRCRRIGRFNEERSRPISVEFLLKSNADYILENRNSLADGIYVDREYDEVTEKNRSILRPFLKAAKALPDYRKKSKLEGSQLKIQSRKFTVETLHKLPKELKLFENSSRQDSASIAYFGIINPLSNFHPASFVLDGIKFHSSEQFIQYQNAKLFNDNHSIGKIMSLISALECKQQGNLVKGFLADTWHRSAKHLCKPGIEAKFLQNHSLMETLVYETGNKTIVEGTKDEIWGSGQPLDSVHCLDQSKWTSQGIMGEILSEIRESYWATTRPTHPGHPGHPGHPSQSLPLQVLGVPFQNPFLGVPPTYQTNTNYARPALGYQPLLNYPVTHPSSQPLQRQVIAPTSQIPAPVPMVHQDI